VRVDLFDFDLPRERIALRPVSPRDSARLLHVQAGGGLDDRIVRDLPDLLRAGDLQVVNDSKVIPARLPGRRRPRPGSDGDGAQIEATLIKRLGDEAWLSFMKNSKRVREGDEISFAPILSARVLSVGEGGEVALSFNRSGTQLDAAIATIGTMPLPPYIASQRGVDDQDNEDYQTRFADTEGSVAAPTAGLHFTDDLLQTLSDKGIGLGRVTLHVGPGTFLPVKVDDTSDHQMHAEWGEVSAGLADRISQTKRAGGRVIAVGTTSLRLLESAARATGQVEAWVGETDIFITPGFAFRAADLLMTNFHLPRSTLFMLVSAFAGLDEMKAAYAHAIETGYRFYSYGDACLLERS